MRVRCNGNAVWAHLHSCQPACDPNAATVVANCDGSNCNTAGDWAGKCTAIPSGTSYITVTMGENVDRFRPIPGYTFCDMLQSLDKHQFWNPNPKDGSAPGWVTPRYYVTHMPHYLGGSWLWWPQENIVGDNRKHLSFWGGYGGGCCQLLKSGGSVSWGRSFTMKAYADCAAGTGWESFPNYCVSETGSDLDQTNTPEGDVDIQACKMLCAAREACSAFEFYASGWGGSRCKLMLGSTQATKGHDGGRWQDAVCVVKPIGSGGGGGMTPPPTCQECFENKWTTTTTAGYGSGYTDSYRGWYDLHGCGRANSYCRWEGNSGSGGDPRNHDANDGKMGSSRWTCALAGTNTGENDDVYGSYESSDPHYISNFFPWTYKKYATEGAVTDAQCAGECYYLGDLATKCPSSAVIATNSECWAANNQLGADAIVAASASNKWDSSHSAIPTGCSTEQGWGVHFNSHADGRARSNQRPICSLC